MALSYEMFVVCPPGLERWLGEEVSELGCANPAKGPGGVSIGEPLSMLPLIHQRSRIASRVLVRIANFRATKLPELLRKAQHIPWSQWLPPDASFVIRSHCKKSRIYHSGAATSRFKDAILHALPQARWQDDENTRDDDGSFASVLVRIERDQVTVSLNATGTALYQRGYKVQGTAAPIRENIAAGILRAVGWRPEEPLWDPMCGSGTFPIEAALIATGTTLAENRSFAYQRWAQSIASAPTQPQHDQPAHIYGSDRNQAAIDAAQENAAAAGVTERISWSTQTLEKAQPPWQAQTGLMVVNPPYGVRMGQKKQLRQIYAAIGQAASKGRGRLALLTPHPWQAEATGLALEHITTIAHGGLHLGVHLSDNTAPQG